MGQVPHTSKYRPWKIETAIAFRYLEADFPEPYLTGRETSYRCWSNTYSNQLIREDIRDLTNIKAIGDLEILRIKNPAARFENMGAWGQILMVS